MTHLKIDYVEFATQDISATQAFTVRADQSFELSFIHPLVT